MTLPPWPRAARAALWAAVALPAVYQLLLLATAIAGRIGYPYDLEWMEGGLLHHALRIRNGEGLYGPPSIDFIPYLYTPLYPAVLALLGGSFGLTYALGRAVSVIALVGISVIAFAQVGSRRHQHAAYAPVLAGVVLALGLFAAAYPYVEGWYDLVRADTMFLWMVTAGIAGLSRWARLTPGRAGHLQVAAGGALLALAFFCKQTGIIYVAFGGVLVLVLAWRRVLAYTLAAGVVGLGGTWLFDRVSDGWFWTYVSKIHRAHDFNMDRFYKSFGNILWHFPAATVVIAAALVIVAVTSVRKRAIPAPAHPFLLWASLYAVSTVVGAIGWGTEFAHFNAYMPALLHGALAAGAAVPAVYACARQTAEDLPERIGGSARLPAAWRAEAIATAAALAAALPLAYTCATATWRPRQFIPTVSDIAAGERLIDRVRAIEGEVWIPSHPWYLHLAGKTPRVHRMGIKDVTARQPRVVEGLDDALGRHAFAALVLDNRDVFLELHGLSRHYRAAMKLPTDERPRLYTGAKIVPDSIWIPSVRATPPPGGRVVFDFESPLWDAGWSRSGLAWGNGPVASALPGQDFVLGATGARFATSMHDGDASTGRLTSPSFALDGARLTLRIGGGTDTTRLRVELWVDGRLAAIASAPPPGGGTLREASIDLADLRGRQGRLVLVDDDPHGHLILDDVWLLP